MEVRSKRKNEATDVDESSPTRKRRSTVKPSTDSANEHGKEKKTTSSKQTSNTKAAFSKSSQTGRRENGIKGIKAADKSNDSLRDFVIQVLNKSGIDGTATSKIVFAHTGIYVGDKLFAWCGPSGLAVRCHNKRQKDVCSSNGCPVYESTNHKEDNYYQVPEGVYSSGKALRKLAEEYLAAGPVSKKK